MSRRLSLSSLLPVALLVVASCFSGDRNSPLEPLTTGSSPQSLISDAAHSNGTPGFFFLPPMVSHPNATGALDTEIEVVNPVVAICDITDGPVVGCGTSTPAIRTFTLTSDPAITIQGDKYAVNWDTGDEGFVAGRLYRVYIYGGVARTELGFADVFLTEKRGQVKNHDGEIIVLNDGRTLPIFFRIEEGVVPREGPAVELEVGGLDNSVVAGTAGSITVTARDASGAVVTGYTGTITFTSGDPLATLPASYTFTSSDAGTHTFPVTLRTAGDVTVTATDAVNSLVGAQSVTVTPAATAQFALAGVPAQTTAGDAHTLTVTAQDQFGNITPGYVGTVQFSSSDAEATVPAAYEFQAADAGVRSFTGVIFETAAAQTLSATDGTASGSLGTTVAPGAVAELRFTTPPTDTPSGAEMSQVVVTAYDAFGNQATNFNGLISVGVPGATLFGTSELAAVGGVATYTDLIIVDLGTFSMTASLGDVTLGTSTPFAITNPVAP